MTYEITWDEDGYPSEQALDNIRRFRGTVREYYEYTATLYRRGGFANFSEEKDEFTGKPTVRASYVTGGWSGCESVAGAMGRGTIWYMRFWNLSKRGGLDEFVIPKAVWESEKETYLGRFEYWEEVNGDKPEEDKR